MMFICPAAAATCSGVRRVVCVTQVTLAPVAQVAGNDSKL